MTFKFSLQKILDLRARLEQEAAAELSRAQKLLHEAEILLQAQKSRREAHIQSWRENIQGQLDMAGLRLYQLSIAAIDERINRQTEVLNECQELVEKNRKDYLAARRRRKVLEKHKEKELVRFREEALRNEQKELDDVAGTRFARQEAASL